jgi:hypothetical protein
VPPLRRGTAVEGACGEGRRAARTAASGDGPPVQGAGRR